MQPVDHLVAAALTGERDRVRSMLADDPGLVGARTMFGVGAVHAAHFGDHVEMIRLLEEHGLPVDMFLAAELGRIDLLRALLAADRALVDRIDERGSTPLHGAAYWGQVEAAELLLDAGADPNATSRDSFLQLAPLASAIATTPGVPQPSDNEDTVLALVRLLLEHGASVTRADGMA